VTAAALLCYAIDGTGTLLSGPFRKPRTALFSGAHTWSHIKLPGENICAQLHAACVTARDPCVHPVQEHPLPAAGPRIQGAITLVSWGSTISSPYRIKCLDLSTAADLSSLQHSWGVGACISISRLCALQHPTTFLFWVHLH
jgi:hypothetical protein